MHGMLTYSCQCARALPKCVHDNIFSREARLQMDNKLGEDRRAGGGLLNRVWFARLGERADLNSRTEKGESLSLDDSEGVGEFESDGECRSHCCQERRFVSNDQRHQTNL